MVKTLTIATRGSMLALWQARFVQETLKENGIDSELNIIKTTGDRVQDRFLHEIGGKGLFIRELETALKAGEADLAIHSMKDLPVNVPDGFAICAVLERHRSGDLLLGHSDSFPSQTVVTSEHLRGLGTKSVGTASLRRASLLQHSCPDLQIKGLRGNVDTRIGKLQAGEYDFIILAAASLDRLKLPHEHRWDLDARWFIPSPAQGALAIEMLQDHHDFEKVRGVFNHRETELRVSIERAVLKTLGGDCTMPCAVHVYKDLDQWITQAGVWSPSHISVTDRVVLGSKLELNTGHEMICDALKEKNVAKTLVDLDLPVPAQLRLDQ